MAETQRAQSPFPAKPLNLTGIREIFTRRAGAAWLGRGARRGVPGQSVWEPLGFLRGVE